MERIMEIPFVFLFFALLSGANAEAVHGAGGAEIQVIPKTNLLTGVYYKIGLPNSDFSVMTYRDLAVPGNPAANFVQLDDHCDHTSKYLPGGEWHKDSLWFFKPSPDAPGFVSIHGYVGDKEKILGVSKDMVTPENEAPADHYLTLVDPTELGQNCTMWEINMCHNGGRQAFSLRNYGHQGIATVTSRFGKFYRWLKLCTGAEKKKSLEEASLTIKAKSLEIATKA